MHSYVVEKLEEAGAEIKRLRLEIERLKVGKFTEEEFQNFCHDNYPCSLQEFQKGCVEYQKQLFGLTDEELTGWSN